MKNTINRYLTYGCSKEFPVMRRIKKSDLSFEDAKDELLRLTNLSIKENITDPENTIFQCSGGLDSTIILSKFPGSKTFSTCKSNTKDYKYSRVISIDYKTQHEYVSEEELIKDINIESTLFEMNSIHSAPRSYINDLGLYSFIKRIKEQTNIIAGGEGVELMFMAYANMYKDCILAAMWYNEYDRMKANEYIKAKKVYPWKIEVNTRDLLRVRKKEGFIKKDYFKLSEWWATGFTQKEINNLGLMPMIKPRINFFDYVNFLVDWCGRELYFDRRLEYADYHGLKWEAPFLDKRFVEFVLTLPLEMRNCNGQIKYLMYEALGHMVPSCVVARRKEGLVLSFDFYLNRKDEILKIVDKYLNNKDAMICDYLEFSEISKIINQFKIQFDFNYLRKVWMLLNLEIWFLTR